VTFEFESVPAETVAFLSQFVPVYPSAEALRIARDRCSRRACSGPGIPTPAFADILSQADLDAAVASIGLPAVLKTRTLGYDGKGQKVLRKPEDVVDTFAELGSVPACWKASCRSPAKCRWSPCVPVMAKPASTRWCTTPTTAAS
jgi:5-(carboxyamino)imidazole ribonucleotide synthase